MRDVLIIGASGHGKVLADIIERQEDGRLIGFLDRQYPEIEKWCGYPVLGRDADVAAVMARRPGALLVLGVGDNGVRRALARRVASLLPDPPFATAVHPAAVIATDVQLAPGTVVMPGAIINAGSTVGQHCVINTGAQLDHDCVLHDFASVGPGAVLGGNVTVGEASAIALGARVVQEKSIGPQTVVGAGAVVLRDLPAGVLAYGIPARVIRPREAGETYL